MLNTVFSRVVIFIAVTATPAAAADEELSATLCKILKELAPKVRDGQPESAQMQLVMSTGGAFNFDGEKLKEVTSKIDRLTSADCSKERDALLSVLKMTSLETALR